MDTYLVVEDENGKIRPLAGIWKNDEAGRINSQEYIKKDSSCKIVEVEIKKLDNN